MRCVVYKTRYESIPSISLSRIVNEQPQSGSIARIAQSGFHLNGHTATVKRKPISDPNSKCFRQTTRKLDYTWRTYGNTSTLGDKYPQEKADDYRQTGLLSAGDVAEMICKHGWDEAQIEIREDELTTWIYDEFI